MELFIELIFYAALIFLCWKFFIKKFFLRSKSFNVVRSRVAANRIPEEAYYEMTAAEVESGNVRAGLWAKALSEALGDEKKAGAIYIKLRVQTMREEAAAAILKNSKADSATPYAAHSKQAYSDKTVIACPKCAKRLRVVTGKHLDITCPHCSGVFRAHT